MLPRWRFAVAGALARNALRPGHSHATIPCGDRDSPSHSIETRSIALVRSCHNAALLQATAFRVLHQALGHFRRLVQPSVPSLRAAANWSLERDRHRQAAWAARRFRSSSASRAKRHPGSGPSAQTLGLTGREGAAFRQKIITSAASELPVSIASCFGDKRHHNGSRLSVALQRRNE